MSYSLHILDSAHKLYLHHQAIEKAFEHAVGIVSSRVEIDVDVCVSHCPGQTNPKFGIGGGAFHESLINIFLDADSDSLSDALDVELPFVLGHEAHHCLRMRSVPNDATLADSLVTEGLACAFERELREIDPSFIPPSLVEDWEKHLRGLGPDLRSEEFCYDTVFLGRNVDRMPKYTGFAVGYGLAREYLAATSQTSVEAAGVTSDEVLNIIEV